MDQAQLKIDSVSTESAVTRAAAELRRIAVLAADDAFLGSEDALAERFGISPPTLRQAARILEFEQLLRIKRGVSGGYYVRRPDIHVAVSTAGTYLAAHGIPSRDAFEVSRALTDLLMRGAALCTDAGLKAELAGFREHRHRSPLDEWKREQAFSDLLARMCGNEVIRLVLLIFNFNGSTTFDENRPIDPALAERFLGLRGELVDAILAGDRTLAESIGQERLALIHRLLLAHDEG